MSCAAGTRTQNDRTKICCVTITPQLNPMLVSGGKGSKLFRINNNSASLICNFRFRLSNSLLWLKDC